MKFRELNKRLWTSAALFPLAILAVYLNQSFFIIFLLLILIITSYEWVNLNKKKISTTSILGFVIIVYSFYSAYLLRGNSEESKIIFLWILFVCFLSDIGGYFFGNIIGGKKITKISPNKTYAGVLGSFSFSIFPILFLYYSNFEIINFNFSDLLIKYIILSLLLSLVCQLGDITVSFFKRKNKVKDTGKLLPGHGGLLDRIDGLIFAIIFANLLKTFNLI